jgi:hypothetical protein
MQDTADRLSDFARQVIEQEGDADEHEVDDELFHPADLGTIAAGVFAGNVNGNGAPRAVDSSNIDGLTANSAREASGSAVGNQGAPARSRSHSVHEPQDPHDDEEDELDSPSSGPPVGRGRKRQKKDTQPLGPGQTRDPVQMKKDSHVRRPLS